jgi:hypothetical protein
MRRYACRDNQWDRIMDLLPRREGNVGGTDPFPLNCSTL